MFIDADPMRMAQVFANLLNNAAKYTEPRGRIELTVKREGPQVAISVKDNGIGIPKDKLDAIFDMFAQVDRSLERRTADSASASRSSSASPKCTGERSRYAAKATGGAVSSLSGSRS